MGDVRHGSAMHCHPAVVFMANDERGSRLELMGSDQEDSGLPHQTPHPPPLVHVDMHCRGNGSRICARSTISRRCRRDIGRCFQARGPWSFRRYQRRVFVNVCRHTFFNDRVENRLGHFGSDAGKLRVKSVNFRCNMNLSSFRWGNTPARRARPCCRRDDCSMGAGHKRCGDFRGNNQFRRDFRYPS